MGVALAVVVIPSLLLMTAVLPRMSFSPFYDRCVAEDVGLLPTDAVVLQRTASKGLNQSMRPQSPDD